MSRQLSFTDYEGFCEKFKPKKTTDDCYTPPSFYDAVTGRNHPSKGGFFSHLITFQFQVIKK